MQIGIIGSGSWATAIAKIAMDNGNAIHWWMRQANNIEYFKKRHHNPHYLRNNFFDTSRIHFSSEVTEIIQASDIIVMAVPSIHVESSLKGVTPQMLQNKKVVSAIKGVLPKYNILLHEYLEKQYQFPLSQYYTLLGPSHAEEVAAEQLSYLTFSGLDIDITTQIASYFKCDYINTHVNHDVIGVQYAGVVKNIYALGAGIAHGLEYGDNFLSVYIANCANEMQVLLKSLYEKGGGNDNAINYASSVYLGDLLVTCYSLHSRNRTFGNMIGKGYSVKSAELELNMVAEGYNASKCIIAINEHLQLDLPIITTIYKILWEGDCRIESFKALEQILI
ncbi:MAG: glycerol-3-phosphate dehydrogenase [Chitinophagia bacterium]|jgi:glycerol-3-phosphate dehydrogenase (NAD(P)+)|nr:glycerol-3-phosphate dehydrogenase [Chitinophagia bacterium]